MTASVYEKIHDAKIDRELETILVKLLQYNSSPVMEVPILHFLQEFVVIRDDFWNQFNKCTSFDKAFDMYYQYSKNKCSLIDLLLDNLNFTITYDPLKVDLACMIKEGLTF
ncbi:MAG: hypothetical protein JHC41_00010 [Nitrosopumilus sp.]|jgi:hypothetical protein|nr:hypothetical protein [Nitrosopumilus sp.]